MTTMPQHLHTYLKNKSAKSISFQSNLYKIQYVIYSTYVLYSKHVEMQKMQLAIFILTPPTPCAEYTHPLPYHPINHPDEISSCRPNCVNAKNKETSRICINMHLSHVWRVETYSDSMVDVFKFKSSYCDKKVVVDGVAAAAHAAGASPARWSQLTSVLNPFFFRIYF